MQFFPGIFYPYKWNVEVYLEPGEAAGQKYSGTEMQQDRKTEGQKGAEL